MTNKEFKIFRKLCKEYFGFLEIEYNCKAFVENKDYGAYCVYRNSTTGIKISYIPRDAGMIYVFIARLINGSFPESPIDMGSTTRLESFDLEDLIAQKAPSLRIERPSSEVLSKPFNVSIFEHTFRQLANALKKHGSDILKGDFTIFSDLEKVVKGRQ